MDTLPSSVSTIKVVAPSLTLTSREFFHLKRTPQTSHLHSHLSTTSKPTSISNQSNSFTLRTFGSQPVPSPSTQNLCLPSPSPAPHHSRPSSGYAAALVDISQCNGSIHLVENDVQRLLKILRNKQVEAALNGSLLGEREKGEVVREIAEKGRFQRHLVRLVKMLIGRNKVGIVRDVLEEFERIYDEMCGTQLVLVSSAVKMEEAQMFGIAHRVQKLSGALKVKVRNFIGESLPSFAS